MIRWQHQRSFRTASNKQDERKMDQVTEWWAWWAHEWCVKAIDVGVGKQVRKEGL